MDSQKPLDSELVTPQQARLVEAKVVPPDSLAQGEINHLKTELGYLGRLVGSRQEKPGNVAFLVIILCFVFLFVAFLRDTGSNAAPFTITPVTAPQQTIGTAPAPGATNIPSPITVTVTGGLTEPFFKLVSVLIGVVGLALGYLFGSSNKS
ncbi:hypothetical protein [Steroidobacter sp.]|uniref:hypothetical protein n=1 Tax=Steroidobacter sp. TaxID=1978227 RepID=UPI001A53C32B|nr:hypothetical protein [Steroidobacter sp.]MBL8269254.1 hypothetical protein [Steroidobacter sp.]